MTAFRVIGIDPALTATGIAVVESSKPGDYRVTGRETVRPKARDDFLTRLRALEIGVENFMGYRSLTTDPVVVEDVLDQVWVHKNKRPGSIAVMGAAVGVVLAAILHRPNIALVKPNEWMPKKAGTRGGWRIMPHAETIRFLLGHIRFEEKGEATEHEIMAAGVARYWVEQERLAARRVSA
jgi:Holliday junction resolvasome RuvABC endonuclease subunit